MSRRRAVLALLALLAFTAIAVAGAGAALLARRTQLAEQLILDALAARGVAPAAVRVVRVDLHGVELAALRIGAPEAPDLAAERIEATWSWQGLRAQRLDTVLVSGLRLRAATGEDGFSLGALDPLLAGGEGDEPRPLPALPAPEIELRDARLALTTPEGPADGELTGVLRADPDGRLDGRLALALDHPLGRATAQLEVTGPLEALDFEATLNDDARRLSATARGRADLAARTAAVEWLLAPLAFEPGGLQPAVLLPALARTGLSEVRGRVEARGRAALAADGALDLGAELAVRDLSFATPLARVERLNGTIALAGLPLHTPRTQVLSIALLDIGVPLQDGVVEWRLRPDGMLALRSTRWRFAGGQLGAEDLVVDPREAPRGAITLRAVDLDLALLLERVALDGLSGTGSVSGELPLELREGSVHVAAGVLRASEAGGTLAYAPAPSVAAMAAARPGDLGLAVTAFSDFRFEALDARLDGELDGEVRVGLHVRGANPGFQDGRPVELNLNLEARLADLVRAGRASYRVPEVVEERLRAYSEEATR